MSSNAMNTNELAAAEHRPKHAWSLVKANRAWIIAVYDAGVWQTILMTTQSYWWHREAWTLTALIDTPVGIYLLTNLWLYSYKKSTKEGIIQMFMLMKAQRLKWSNCEVSIQHEVRSQDARIAMLLQQDYVWKLIDMIINVLFMYYVHLDIFKISTLMSIFLSMHGGVSGIHFCMLLVTSGCHSFSQPSLSILRSVTVQVPPGLTPERWSCRRKCSIGFSVCVAA